ncbi:PSD1 and planctomycete cytochrome C domain-containing protein [Planctomyces sp. SH-PL62]|uniref:PSD1 and planctomycete cytochrome C domain-containing protein n=1 Tax=Planctomyces sp. SH-PL62 TaxID=1636152 RepID=UPI00078E1F2A|nr:PSD1 and planctomycete cytochrome C domain-containing protein [Planctomyces sp. SH-PL62]AMV40669.1 Planctomycete cytochrome C [Planctomyces sp. SH-PL62]
MYRFATYFGSAWIAVAALAATDAAGAGDDRVDYNRDVRPLLSKNCFACHGADESTRAAELRLDLRDEAVKATEERDAAIVPDDPESSVVMERILDEDDTLRMPPRKAGPRLSEAEVETLRKWIAQGAEYAEHWALVPPKAPPTPAVSDPSWPRSALDAFILARLDREGLKPSPQADRATLLRRVSLDLRGLPPTLDEVRAFAEDPAPDAYERAVERYLADPAFGERWARPWLDLARYADSAGYGSDPLRTIWGYRDWLIDALNRNLPYDQFTVDQIAGDLLPGATDRQRAATAFHRNTMTNTEGGTDDEEFRIAAIKDRVDVTFQAWMGLTMGCAKCHSHKYDPISHEEYYGAFAIFNQTADADLPDESPVMPWITADEVERLRGVDARLAELKGRLDAIVGPPAPTLRDEIAREEKSRAAVPTLPIMAELPPEKHRVTHVLLKGNFLDPGPEVPPILPKALHPAPEGAPINRLTLARWLVDRDNPLTARVAANRAWGLLFGAGIVETEEDFGTQGELPSHPELLDRLAVDFMDSGWDVKGLIRRLVTSATYRQASKATPEMIEKDPKNRLLARAPRVRLDAESVRDQALAFAGLLGRKVGGPSVFPVQPDGLWQAAFNGQRTWTTSPGVDRYRRGLYTFWRRTVPYPSMAAFDAPSREVCAVRRVSTNTPLQALVTLNDPVYIEAAQGLARRIVREGGSSPEERSRYGLEVCLGRPARDDQVAQLVALHAAQLDRYRRDPAAAAALATDPLGPLPEGLDPADLAAWTAVANVLLNLDAVLTRG